MKEKDLQETDSGLYLMDGDIDPDLHNIPDFIDYPPKRTIKPEFDYHTPSADQLERITKLREAYSDLRAVLDGLCNQGRYMSLACTALEESCMWAIKGVILD